MAFLRGWTPRERHAVLAAYLGWALDAFDFFLVPPQLTFAVSDTQYLITFAGLLGSTLAPLAVFQTVPVVTWLAPSAITYWNNYLTTLTDQFCQTFLDAPSFNN